MPDTMTTPSTTPQAQPAARRAPRPDPIPPGPEPTPPPGWQPPASSQPVVSGPWKPSGSVPVSFVMTGQDLRASISLTRTGSCPAPAGLVEDLQRQARAAIAEKLAGNDLVQRYQRLRRQSAAAQQALTVAQARVEEAEARKQRLTVEAGDNLAQDLQALGRELAELRAQHAQAAADVGTIEPLAEEARAPAEQVLTDAVKAVRAGLYSKLAEDRQEVIGRLVEVVSPVLSELAGLNRILEAGLQVGALQRSCRPLLDAAPAPAEAVTA